MSPEAVHRLAGALILVFVALGLAKEWGQMRGAWLTYLLPASLCGVGLFLLLDPIVFHGGDFGVEGLQHQLQGALLLGIGAVEVARSRGRLEHRAFGALLPIAIVIVGLLFVLHSQHGGGDAALQMVQHRILGTTIMLAGIVKGADALKLAKGNWAAVGWLLLLLAVATQLFLYTEGGASGGALPSSHGAHGVH